MSLRRPSQYKDRIICGDNIKIMQEMPAGCVDLTVTSPPYGEIRDYEGYQWSYQKVAASLLRVTRPGGVCVWVVADQTKNGDMSGDSFMHALEFKRAGWLLRNVLIYVKNRKVAGMQINGDYYNNFEYIFVFTKPGGDVTYHTIADSPRSDTGRAKAVTVDGKTAYKIRKGYRNKDGKTYMQVVYVKGYDPDYVVRGRVWRYVPTSLKENQYRGEHPAEFPEQLATDCIASWSNPGDLIFDPFCGSGTTCKMGRKQRRYYCGVDISAKYCELARRRVGSVR